MGRSKTVRVAVVGESGAGKSALIRALTGRPAVMEDKKAPRQQTFWGYQAPAENGKITHQAGDLAYSLALSEVLGSRGRMSNVFNLREAIKRADVILFCTPYASVYHQYALNKVLSAVEFAKNEKASMIVVRTRAEEEKFGEEEGDCFNDFPSLEVSAVTGQGVNEIIPAILQAYVNGSPAVLSSRKKKNMLPEEAAKRVRSTVQTTVQAAKDQQAQVKEDAKLAAALVASLQDAPPAKRAKLEGDVPPVA